MKPVRVLMLARPPTSHVLRRSFRPIKTVEVVAAAGDGVSALDLVRVHRPRVLLADLTTMGDEVLEAVGRMTSEFPGVRAAVLAPPPITAQIPLVLRAGVTGLLSQDAAASEIAIAMLAVDRGALYLAAEAAQQFVTDLLRQPMSNPANDQLSTRQRQTLQLIAEGQRTKEIAGSLGISPKTVEAHRTQLMRKLDIHDIAGLVRYAVRIGLVRDP